MLPILEWAHTQSVFQSTVGGAIAVRAITKK
jgi:hypothetical protein